MSNGRIWLNKARYYSSVTLIYLVTLLFGLLSLHPAAAFQSQANALEDSNNVVIPQVHVISGFPVRIVVPSQNIDVPIDPGIYDPATNSWNLSGYHAQFATITSLANNYRGNTFIYGHYNPWVFLRLKFLKPGDQAFIYTSNGHEFEYTYEKMVIVPPEDTAVLTSYSGRSILTLQTCTGDWFQLRQLQKFNFTKVLR